MKARGAQAATAARRVGEGRAGGDGAQAEQKKQKAEQRRQAARLSELEASIAALEQRLAELLRDLEDAGVAGDGARVRSLGEEYAQIQKDLNGRIAEWEEEISN